MSSGAAERSSNTSHSNGLGGGAGKTPALSGNENFGTAPHLLRALRTRDPILAKQLVLASRYPDKAVIRRVLALRLRMIGGRP